MISKFMVGYNFAVAGFGLGVILGTSQFNLTLFVLSALNLLVAMHLFSKYNKNQEVEEEDVEPESPPPAA